MILEQCKGVHCVDLGESFQTHILLHNLASIRSRTSLSKFHAADFQETVGSHAADELDPDALVLLLLARLHVDLGDL